MSVQTTIQFNIRKKCSFYGTKENISKQDFSEATIRSTPDKYVPTVKKIVTLSSSESESESESDENVLKEHNARLSKQKTCTNRSPRVRKSNDMHDQHGSTPPKQKKVDQSPQETALTPSTLLNRLNLSSPAEKDDKLAPKRLFSCDKYSEARKALHSSTPESLPGRETELKSLNDFIKNHLDSGTSASLYVSGPPGTGKTACLSEIMRRKEYMSQFQIVYVNCTTMKSAAAIYGKIIKELNITVSSRNNKNIIEKYLATNHKMLLFVLDEIDQLQSKQQSVLYSIFEWPSIPNSKLILIGIANALDLTDRILPRLQARCELKPKLIHFSPYNKQQIFDIISKRLNDANVADVFSQSALQMLSGKVAAISGDIRRALDISRRLVELAESHKSSRILQSTMNNDKKEHPVIKDKAVDLKDVVTVLNGVYGGSQSIDKEESSFPLQQKLLLCSLLLILNMGRNKDVTVGKLHEVYKKVCKKRNIHCVDISEFVGLCSLIETRGVLRVIGKKEPRLSKISLQWDQEELDAGLQDKNMLAEIISDVACL